MRHTILNSVVACIAALSTASCNAQAAQEGQPEYSDGTAAYGSYGPWTIYQTESETFDHALSCAAVANLPDSYDAIRIERVADGYLLGMNGFDRENFGENGEYPLKYWFDADTSKAVAGTLSSILIAMSAFRFWPWMSQFLCSTL